MVVYDTSERWNVLEVNMCFLHRDHSDEYQVAGAIGAYRQRVLDVSSDYLLNRRRHNKGSFTTGSSYFDTSVIDQGGWK